MCLSSKGFEYTVRDRGTETPFGTTLSQPFCCATENLSRHLLLSFLTHALPIETVMGPRPGGVGACLSFMLLQNLSSLHELEVLAALRDVGSLRNWVEHREELELVAVEGTEIQGSKSCALGVGTAQVSVSISYKWRQSRAEATHLLRGQTEPPIPLNYFISAPRAKLMLAHGSCA